MFFSFLCRFLSSLVSGTTDLFKLYLTKTLQSVMINLNYYALGCTRNKEFHEQAPWNNLLWLYYMTMYLLILCALLFSMCSAAEVECAVYVVYKLNSFIWNDRLFRWRYSVTPFCVYAVFVIVSVDSLSVILPILKLTSSLCV